MNFEISNQQRRPFSSDELISPTNYALKMYQGDILNVTDSYYTD